MRAQCQTGHDTSAAAWSGGETWPHMNPWPGIRSLLGGRGSRRSASSHCSPSAVRTSTGPRTASPEMRTKRSLLQETTIRGFRSNGPFRAWHQLQGVDVAHHDKPLYQDYRKASRRAPEASLDDIDQDLWIGPDGPHIRKMRCSTECSTRNWERALDALPARSAM